MAKEQKKKEQMVFESFANKFTFTRITGVVRKDLELTSSRADRKRKKQERQNKRKARA